MSTTTDAPGVVIVPARLDAKQAGFLLNQHPESVKRNVRNGVLQGGVIGNKVMVDGHSVADTLRACGIRVVVEDVAA